MKKRLAQLAMAAGVIVVADVLIPGIDSSEVLLQLVLFGVAAVILFTKRFTN